MIHKILLATASLAGGLALLAQPLTLPRIGAGRDVQARWRTISGMAGTLLAGPVLFENVAAGASNGSRHVVQTASELLVSDSDGTVVSRQPLSSSDPAVLTMSASGNTALAWVGGTASLLRWQSSDSRWTAVNAAFDGSVVALQTSDTRASLVVRRDNRWSWLTIDLSSSAIIAEQTLPSLSQAVQLAPDRTLLWADEQNLHVLDATGNEILAPLPGPVTHLAAIGPNWWQATNENSQSWALRRQGSQIDWFELPSSGGDQ